MSRYSHLNDSQLRRDMNAPYFSEADRSAIRQELVRRDFRSVLDADAGREAETHGDPQDTGESS